MGEKVREWPLYRLFYLFCHKHQWLLSQEHEMELARPKKKEPSPKKEEKKAPVAAKPAARPLGGHGQCTPGIYDARLKHLKDGQDDDEIDQIKKEIKEAMQ